MAFAALGSFSCGFAPLGDARELLNVRFAVTGLLFLVFDLEVHFALAWTFDATTGSWQLLVANWLCWASLIGERESCWSTLRHGAKDAAQSCVRAERAFSPLS